MRPGPGRGRRPGAWREKGRPLECWCQLAPSQRSRAAADRARRPRPPRGAPPTTHARSPSVRGTYSAAAKSVLLNSGTSGRAGAMKGRGTPTEVSTEAAAVLLAGCVADGTVARRLERMEEYGWPGVKAGSCSSTKGWRYDAGRAPRSRLALVPRGLAGAAALFSTLLCSLLCSPALATCSSLSYSCYDSVSTSLAQRAVFAWRMHSETLLCMGLAQSGSWRRRPHGASLHVHET
eukprot:scaffold44_cov411-Prasinococcus_capsulatus_cf.AAC.30